MLLDIFHIHVHNLVSIAVILVILIASIIVSVVLSEKQDEETEYNKSDMFEHAEKKKEIEDAFETDDIGNPEDMK